MQFQFKVNGGASATIAAALQHWLVLSCQRKSLDFFFGLIVLMKGHGMGGEGKEGAWRTQKKKAGREMGGRASEWSDSSSVWLRWLMETDGRPPERSQTSGAALLPRPLAFNPLRVCMRDAQISWGLPEEVNTSTDTEPWREKKLPHDTQRGAAGGGLMSPSYIQPLRIVLKSMEAHCSLPRKNK